MTKEFFFETDDLISQLPHLSEKGVTELALHDEKLSGNKKAILNLMNAIAEKSPDLFISIPVNISVIDNAICNAAQNINCSLEIEADGNVKGDALLFDKKLFSNRAALMNNAGLVFGFNLEWGTQAGDNYKLFRERLDFLVSLYPNHIDFKQLSLGEKSIPKPTGIFSPKDLEFARNIAFACYTFYSAGRAVPWFNSVLKPLKISPSAFFADFAEWQKCSSCSFETGFNPDDEKHINLEKMQLVFLRQKYEEKHKEDLFLAAEDLVKLNGAFSRLASDGEECIIDVTYNPDDLLSPQAFDLDRFCDNVCYEDCSVKIFLNEDYPDYKILD